MDLRYYESYRKLQDEHWWFQARSKILEELIAAWGLAPEHGEILDIGCGPGGPLLQRLSRRYRVEGLDAEPAAVAIAHQQGLANVRVGTLDSLTESDGGKDLALLLDVIEHVEQDVQMLNAARRVLRPGGCLLVTVPALPWLWSGHDRLAHHYRRYRQSELKTKLETAGWVCERITFFNTLLFPLAAVKKLADRFRKGSEQHGYYDTPGKILNGFFRAVFASEARWLKNHTFLVGVSLLAVGRKH